MWGRRFRLPTARSLFGPQHKRKTGSSEVEALEPPGRSAVRRWGRLLRNHASGPGGQHVNRTESAFRVTHVPTGLHASASEERSQHKNKKLALARLSHTEDLNHRQRGEAGAAAGKRIERGSAATLCMFSKRIDPWRFPIFRNG